MNEDFVIIKEPPDFKEYRTEIPNMIFALELPVQSTAIYCYIKSRADTHKDGICCEGVEKMSRNLQMSVQDFIHYRDHLRAGRAIIHVYDDEDGSQRTSLVKKFANLGDVWVFQNSVGEA